MNDRIFWSKALFAAFALLLLCALSALPAYSANSGLDTPTGVTSLPFSVQGTEIMTLYDNGLGIGRAEDGGWQLEVAGTGNQHGIFGQAGAGGYWGVGGWSNDGNSYGGLGVANAYGSYGASTNGQGAVGVSTNSYAVYGASTNSWGGVFTGADGVYGQSTTGWAGQFYTTNSQNGVWIGNPSNNAQLCLNGQCVTSFPTGNTTIASNSVNTGAADFSLSVACPSGTTMTGGGGSCNGNCETVTETAPSGNGWFIFCNHGGACNNSPVNTGAVYAVCMH